MRVAHEDAEAVAVVLDVAQQRDSGHFELLHGVFAAKQGRRHAEEAIDLTVDHHRVEPFLAAEVLVDNWLGDAGPGGNFLDRGAVQAALREQAAADVQELLAALLAGHSPSSRRRGLARHCPIMQADVTDQPIESVTLRLVIGPSSRAEPTFLPVSRLASGQRTFDTQPSFSASQMP